MISHTPVCPFLAKNATAEFLCSSHKNLTLVQKPNGDSFQIKKTYLTCENDCLILLSSPWNQKPWTGTYCKGSVKWKLNRKVQEDCYEKFKEQLDDKTFFWMCLSDF